MSWAANISRSCHVGHAEELRQPHPTPAQALIMLLSPHGLKTSLSPQGLNTLDNPEAVGRLKYMLLCKIMTSKGDAEEVPAIISSRAGLKYAGEPPIIVITHTTLT